MPLINIIRGERIEPAPFNIRTPYLRMPLWLMLTAWLIKGLWRLVRVYVRFWYLTMPATGLWWLHHRYGWVGLALTAGVPTVLGTVWGLAHRPSFRRFVWWPVLGRWRRLGYRRNWHAAMTTTRLTAVFDADEVLPALKRVQAGATGDRLTIRMVTGQIPDDFAKAGERLAHAFGAIGYRVVPGPRPGLVVLNLRRTDPLAAIVPPLPVPAVPDFTGLPVAMTEDGGPYRLRLFGTQVLVVGATGAGKGSVIWSFLRSVAAGIYTGLVEVWAFDPKGGMELGAGQRLFARFACEDYHAMADMLDEALAAARRRAARLRGVSRQHIPTPDEPLIVIIIDELAALTAYLTERQLKDRIKATLGLLLTQGRAVGVHVLACLQDPRKEVLPFRNLFPTRIGLRLTEEAEVDLVLGDGARDRGALCDRIPQSTPGVGFVVLDGDPSRARVRFSYLDDTDIHHLATAYGPDTWRGDA